jgi:glutamyl-tRNA reductase
VLLIGAGDTIELAARHLREANVKRLFVANRTLEHAQQLASKHGGIAFSLSDIDTHLHEADIVISATAAREPILHRSHVQHSLQTRKQRPMLLLDLAVPRDIEPSVSDLSNVYLYTVDDLEQVIEDNRAMRRAAANEAETMIDLQTEHFMNWWRARDQQQVLQELREHAEHLRQEAITRAQEQLANGDAPNAVIERLAHQLTNKLLHAPTQALREAALSGNVELINSAQRLFDTKRTPPDDSEPAA